jgi:hypothetical protein
VVFGLPIDAWVLLIVSVGLGLGLEIVFYRARRGDTARTPSRDPGDAS